MEKTVLAKKDLKKYLSCYDKDFESRGMKLSAWRKHRQKLNMKHKILEIKITDIKILDRSDNQADEYKDLGTKEMLLENEGEHWKIKKEEWKPMGG